MPGHRRLLLAAIGLVLGLVVIQGIAIAGHQFTDVPDANIFHDDIAWLADNGITKGCNPPTNTEFCPGETVRRETMAAFMHRLAVNQVVDAGTLQGFTASELTGSAAAGRTFATCGDRILLTNSEVTEIGHMPISIPDKGTISLTSQVSLDVNIASDGSLVHLWQTLDATCESNSGATAQGYSDLTSTAADIATFTTALPVGNGRHVVRTCATSHQLVGSETTNVVDSHISVVWSPTAIEVLGSSSSGHVDQDVAKLASEVQARAAAMRDAMTAEVDG